MATIRLAGLVELLFLIPIIFIFANDANSLVWSSVGDVIKFTLVYKKVVSNVIITISK